MLLNLISARKRAGRTHDKAKEKAEKGKKRARFIRCAKCNQVMELEGALPVRCPNCQEHFNKCRYCIFSDLAIWECINPDVRHSIPGLPERRVPIDPDVFMRCRYYRTNLLYQPPPKVQVLKRVATKAILAAVVSLFIGGLAVSLQRWSAGRFQPPAVELLIFCPAEVESESPFRARMVIWNRDRSDSGPLTLRVNPQFFNFFKLDAVQPQPLNVQITYTGWYFSYPSLPGDSQMLIELYATALRPGHTRLSVALFSRSNFASVVRKRKVDVQ